MAEAKVKIIKKKWLSIKASKFFGSEPLGECYVQGPDKLTGRTITANLANLTGDIRQQSVTLRFIVNTLDGETGVADAIGYEMSPSAIRRMVRRGSDRIDDTIECETSDGQQIIIKPMIITKALTNSEIHRSLRKLLSSSIAKNVKKHAFEELINEIITSKIQMAIKTELKKVYPLKAVEIKSLKLLGNKKNQPEMPSEEAPEATKAEA